MANKKKTVAHPPIHQLIAYAAPKEDKCILSLPISETENIDIEVKSLLSVDEMVSFVNGVTNAIFPNGTYMPAIYRLVYANAIIFYYTDFQDMITNEDLVSLVFCTDIIAKVEERINRAQIQEMIEAICKNIKSKQEEIHNTQSSRLEESIRQMETLTEIVSKFAEQFQDIDMKQATEAAIKLSNMPERNIVNNILDVKFGENAATGINESSSGGDENV